MGLSSIVRQNPPCTPRPPCRIRLRPPPLARHHRSNCAFEAGSFASFTLAYTAGYFGIDDTGSIKIVHRFASDMGKPQFTDP